MEKSPFRNRGLRVVVDTSAPAEFDAARDQVPETVLKAIAANLKEVPFSDRDQIAKTLRVRQLFNFDVVFYLSRELQDVLVNIVAIRPHRAECPIHRRLRVLRTIATLRSAGNF